MRSSLLALLSLGLLAGCAGNIADHIGPKTGIVADQLTRYGFDAGESQCMGERLATGLTPLQLRRLERAASAVERGYFDPSRLTPRDFRHVATTFGDSQVPLEYARAADACGMTPVAVAAPLGPPEVSAPAAATGDATAAAPGGAATWVNLGAALSGQEISVDAASVEKGATTRTAWFRMNDPGATEPTGVSYRLKIDCPGKIIAPLAHRRQDAAGTISDYLEYGPEEAGPIEGGTVMEIAYLALCT